jgi:hypothetical protein
MSLIVPKNGPYHEDSYGREILGDVQVGFEREDGKRTLEVFAYEPIDDINYISNAEVDSDNAAAEETDAKAIMADIMVASDNAACDEPPEPICNCEPYECCELCSRWIEGNCEPDEQD